MIKINLADIDLFPHNQETYDKICEAWLKKNKVAVVQATGTGKSYLIMKCMSNFMFQQKLIIAPSNYILDQIKETSDGGDTNTTYITYQKLTVMSDDEIKELKASLIVLDEFHRCGADAWGKKVVNLLENNYNAKILGTSATPIRYLDNERNMSDEIFDGNVVTNLSLSDAIVQGILPMPKYISTLFTFNEEIDKLKSKINSEYNDKPTRKNLLIEIDQLKRKLDKSQGAKSIINKHLKDNNESVKKFIVFCRNVEHLENMVDIVVDWFSNEDNVIPLRSYAGYDNSNDEFIYFKESNQENSTLLLFAVDMLNEGIHLNDITGVILLRPTYSPNIYYQQIGRAIQTGYTDKIPLIFDFVNNFDNIGTYQFISDIEKSKESARKRNKKVIDVPTFLIIDEIKEVKDMFYDIEEKINTSWDFWYEKLVEFYKENGHSNVQRKKGTVHKNTELAYFVKKQRERYKEGMLSNKQIEKLESIGFAWNMYDAMWDEMYSLLIEFKKEFDHTNVSAGRKYKEKSLGDWVVRQRSNYRRRELRKDQIDKLNKLNFEWDKPNGKSEKIPPLGYKYEGTKLVEDENDTPIIKELFMIMSQTATIEEGENLARNRLKELGVRKTFKFSMK